MRNSRKLCHITLCTARILLLIKNKQSSERKKKKDGVNYCFVLVLLITCFEGQFGIDCSTAFLKILKSPEPNMWLLVNHTKPTNTLYWNWHLLTAGNYKSASGHLLNSGQLQNNSVMLIKRNRVIMSIIL